MAFFKKSKIEQAKIIPIEDEEELVKFAKKSEEVQENAKKKIEAKKELN
jgi:hypothetical protein